MKQMDNRLTVFADAAELGRSLGGEIVELVESAARNGDSFVLGCPGGRTPGSTYAAMAAEFARRDTDLSGLIIAMMDDYLERVGDEWHPIPADAHNSCRRFAHVDIQAVFNAGVSASHRIPDEHVWGPNPADPAEYDRRLTAHGGVDFFILATGAGDGHIAFNPPGSDEQSTTRVVELAEQTRRDNLATFPDFDGLDAVPTHGVTVGIATIATQSKRAAMIALGDGKQDAVRRLLDGDRYDPEWPATVYRTMPGVRLYADAAAAALA